MRRWVAFLFVAALAAGASEPSGGHAADRSPNASLSSKEWTDDRIAAIDDDWLVWEASWHLREMGRPFDPDLAERLFEEAYRRGGEPAYGPALEFLKVPGQGERAVRWFKRAGKDGDYLSYESAGHMYMTGENIAQDYERARECFELSPTVLSRVLLADLVYEGLGGPADPARAEALYRDAAWRGSDIAARRLGDIYYGGLTGRVDFVESYAWHVVAFHFDIPESRLKMNKLAESMSAGERKEGWDRGQDYLAVIVPAHEAEEAQRRAPYP